MPRKNATGASKFAWIILLLYSGRIEAMTRNVVVPYEKREENQSNKKIYFFNNFCNYFEIPEKIQRMTTSFDLSILECNQ